MKKRITRLQTMVQAPAKRYLFVRVSVSVREEEEGSSH